jgi:hypothetical protein
MKDKNILLNLPLAFILVSFCLQTLGQPATDWHSFRDKGNSLYGFKDNNGTVKIKPKFIIISSDIFKDVIAVIDGESHKGYYLNKKGKKFGMDSLYVFDFTYDNLSDGKLRFRDKRTDKVGFFNSEGKVVIPALYNDATPFTNGFSVVLHSGNRICWDGKPYSPANPCEHWGWKGKTALIDQSNKIIADNIYLENYDDINWYQLKINRSIPDKTLYSSFKAKNGSYYSFLNFKKEFTTWFYKSYLKNIKTTAGNSAFYKTVYTNINNRSTRFYTTTEFIKKYKNTILQKTKAISKGVVKADILNDELNPFIYEQKLHPSFYNKYGLPDKQKHPVFNVLVSHHTKNKTLDYQDHLSFIRTDSGYKLFEVGLKIGQ